VYDVDGDGSIDFKEFYLILFVLGGGTPEEKLGHIFRVFDLNHNGFVTRDEVNKIVKDLYPLLGKIDNPDHLNQQDMSKLAFGEADFNHDNKITKDEFIKACLGSDKIVAVLAFKMIDVVSAESSC